MTAMGYREAYAQWTAAKELDGALRAELEAIREDEREQEERFYAELEFGTAGIRGILGAGTNRMNVHVVRRATKGLADYLNTFPDGPSRGVAIAYDSRRMSKEFALETALVLAQNGVKAYLYDSLRAVPQLSFTVLHLRCMAGVVITASHNPPQYNGYKVYWEHGGQTGPEQAEEIFKRIERAGYFSVSGMPESEALERGLLQYIGTEIDEEYYKATSSLLLDPELLRRAGEELKVVYTPLHGAGRVPVTRLLSRVGVKNLFVVPEQAEPNGDFPTVKAPNPEFPEAFELGIRLADEKGADLILATDPDSDRLGVAVRRGEGGFALLTGNQIGSLLIHYILSTRAEKGTLPKNGLVVKSIVSTSMADAVCAHYGVEMRHVLTGFRFISEQIAECVRTGERTFLFGFEESYGFLAGSFARDKDAVCAAMLVAEAAAKYAQEGKTLYDVLGDMYATYGYFAESVKSYTLEGKAGVEKIARAMAMLRGEEIKTFGGLAVESREDLKAGERRYADGRVEGTGLPRADVLRYFLEGGSWLCVRPSGTEPKLKLYIGGAAGGKRELDELLARLTADADGRLTALLS